MEGPPTRRFSHAHESDCQPDSRLVRRGPPGCRWVSGPVLGADEDAAMPPTCASSSPGAPQMDLEVFDAEAWPRRAVGPGHGGPGTGPGHHRPAAVHRGRLLPHRRDRRAPRALPGRVRPATEDRHRVPTLWASTAWSSAPSSPKARPPEPRDHALACLLGLLGLRVGEACSIDIEDLSLERGHRTVTVLGKGSKLAVIPLPPRVARAVDLAAGERSAGPLLLTRVGTTAGPPRRHPDRPPTRQASRDHQAHLPALAAPQLHHRRPRRRRAAPRRADRRPPRRSAGPPPATTGPATTSTATPATSSPLSSLAAR